jgi:hypothetical protein
MTIKFTSIPPKTLSQAILSTATTFRISDIVGWDNVDLTSASFGSVAFGAFLSADRTVLELFSFDPSTIANSSISFVDRGLDFTGQNTSVTANKLDWPAGTTVQLGADTPQILTLLADLGGTQTFTGVKTFTSTAKPKYNTHPTFSADEELIDKKYADDLAIAGAPNMSLTVKGIGEEATQAEIDAGTQTGGTGAELIVNPKYLKDSIYYTQLPSSSEKSALVGDNTDIAVGSGNKYVTQTGLQKNAEKYAVDNSGSSTAYTITLSPVPTGYADGMVVHAKIVNANTNTTPTLSVNGLTARTIVKLGGTALAVGDITANSYHTFIYDLSNTRWVMQDPPAVLPGTYISSSAITCNSQFSTSPSTSTTGTVAIPSNASFAIISFTGKATSNGGTVATLGYGGLRIDANNSSFSCYASGDDSDTPELKANVAWGGGNVTLVFIQNPDASISGGPSGSGTVYFYT